MILRRAYLPSKHPKTNFTAERQVCAVGGSLRLPICPLKHNIAWHTGENFGHGSDKQLTGTIGQELERSALYICIFGLSLCAGSGWNSGGSRFQDVDVARDFRLADNKSKTTSASGVYIFIFIDGMVTGLVSSFLSGF